MTLENQYCCESELPWGGYHHELLQVEDADSADLRGEKSEEPDENERGWGGGGGGKEMAMGWSGGETMVCKSSTHNNELLTYIGAHIHEGPQGR